MELNLLINIFKKEPGNIPPRAGDAQAPAVGSGKGKGRHNRDIFCPKVLFPSFQKNKKGQEILPVWHSQQHHIR